jgi:DNA-binding CsgD family transcriptional regulator
VPSGGRVSPGQRLLVGLGAPARRGDEADRAGASPGGVEGAFPRAAAAHAAALVAGDGPALLAAAEAFAAMGALLVAAEAADAAANAFQEAGRQSSARAAALRASGWLAACEGAHPPTLRGRTGPAGELTEREREIALLAASGLSSREIADRLVVSVRTVDNHLQRAYRKLGISRREDLADVLATAR